MYYLYIYILALFILSNFIIKTLEDFMGSYEFITFISTLAYSISQNKTQEEVELLALFFTQLGDTLATLSNINFKWYTIEKKTIIELFLTIIAFWYLFMVPMVGLEPTWFPAGFWVQCVYQFRHIGKLNYQYILAHILAIVYCLLNIF